MIYLDYNRTTPLAPSVLEAMQPFWMTHFMLPGQEHSHAQAVSEALEQARESVAGLVGCEPFEIVFTDSGTDANNLAIFGQLTVPPQSPSGAGHILVSELEHDSVIAAAQRAESFGYQLEFFPCEPDGVVDPDRVKSRLRSDTRLVCLQLANPVFGTLQPVREVADLCHNRGVRIHCDATQVFGKLPVEVTRLRVDTLSVSGHKFYGPKGSGAIYVRRGLRLSPIRFGEPREMGLRAGPENVPACIGLGAAANLASRCSSEVADNFQELSALFFNGLRSALDKEPILFAEDSPRIANTLAIELPCEASRIQKSARQLVFATAQSTEPADEMTRSLRAIGCSQNQIQRTIRISLGWTTSRDELLRAASLLAEACDGILS